MPGDDIATSDQANADYNAALEAWGDRLHDAGVRLCVWSKSAYRLSIDCPAPISGAKR